MKFFHVVSVMVNLWIIPQPILYSLQEADHELRLFLLCCYHMTHISKTHMLNIYPPTAQNVAIFRNKIVENITM